MVFMLWRSSKNALEAPIEAFLGVEKFVDLNKKNEEGMHCGHFLMSEATNKAKRLGLLRKLLQAKGPDGKTMNLREEDNNRNTMLHYAAKSGLEDCAMFLIDRGLATCLTRENKSGQTPAALADESEPKNPALAAKMEGIVVYQKQDSGTEARTVALLQEIMDEDNAYATHRGMRLQDIRDQKDQQILTTTSFLYGNDICKRTMFNAGELLSAYKWDTEQLQMAWLTDKQKTCYKAGIDPDKKWNVEAKGLKCLTCGEGAETEEEIANKGLEDPLAREIAVDIRAGRNMGQVLPKYRAKGKTTGDIMKAFNKAQAFVMGGGGGKAKPEAPKDPLVKVILGLIRDKKMTMPQVINKCRKEGHKAGQIMRAYQKAMSFNAAAADSERAEEEQKAGPKAPKDPLVKRIWLLRNEGKTMPQIVATCREEGHAPRDTMKAYQKALSFNIASAGEDEGSKKAKIELVPIDSCGHTFCKDCWKRYLEVKIKEGEVQSIVCPAFKCHHRVPASIIDQPLVNARTAQRYMRFELRDFVKVNNNIQWCPAPGCEAAVCRSSANQGKNIGNTADCGEGHFFCFECKDKPHDPCSCEEWRRWSKESQEMSAKLGLGGSSQDAAAVATMLWLKSNTKQCPKCKNGIQKNEGCNHMTCRACRHEFCWICMAPWRTHGSKTGGYYKCNVYKGPGPTDNKGDAQMAKKRLADSKRFIHFVERIKNHEDSKEKEQRMVRKAGEKIAEMQNATQEVVDTTFVGVSFRQLYWNRIVLCASYIKKYYDTPGGGRGKISLLPANFERLQANLERTTEDLSNAIARKRWTKPRHQVVMLTQQAQQARNSFLNTLIPARQMAKRRVESKGGRAKPKSVGAFECKRCTFQNSGGDRCAICGYERPAPTSKAEKRDSGSFSRKSRGPSSARKASADEKKSSSSGGRNFDSELAQLLQMGYTDTNKIIKALRSSDGNIGRALEILG